jgi:peptidoglycan/xylan/chitin deacetylase (PgdA/CDA1 family)
LYCDWNKRDSLLVSRGQFQNDFAKNLQAIAAGNWQDPGNQYFIPPYEWWNDAVARWCNEIGITLLSFTPGTTSNADYTWPEMGAAYKTSEAIIEGIKHFEATDKNQLNGVILLIHAGTDPRRKDKLYDHLEELILYLKDRGYSFKQVEQLLNPK